VGLVHTAVTAFQLHQEHLTGTLEVSKQADLVHTDRDVSASRRPTSVARRRC
jgi:imidazolonepropionase-like amidohydrolase